MHTQKWLLLRAAIPVLIFLFTWVSVNAQTQFNGWFASFNTIKLKDKLSFYYDIQLRSTDKVEHVQALLLRPGLNYQVSKNKILTAGYAFIHNRRTSSGITGYMPEHRIWEQFTVSHNILFAPLAHRFRLEQRFIGNPVPANNELNRDGYVFANRFRYFFRSVIPFSGEKKFVKGIFGAIQNEVFLNIGDKSNVNGKTFDQNRAYLAFGYRFSKSFDIEAGYLNQYISGRNNAVTNNHVLQFATYTRL
ncbi:MAG: DUF2490 domain-containing protein [Agriterribacter sp.]